MSKLFRIAVLFAAIFAVTTCVPVSSAFGADDAETEHVKGEHGDGHSADPNPLKADVPLALWSLGVFLVFLFLLKIIAWKPMTEGLATREANIRGAIDEAHSAREQAAKLLSDHEAKIAGTKKEVDEIIAEARRDAQHTANEIKAKAEAEAEATRSRVLTDIERAKDQAIDELASRERDLIANATETVLGRTLTDDDRGRLIDEALSQFGQKS